MSPLRTILPDTHIKVYGLLDHEGSCLAGLCYSFLFCAHTSAQHVSNACLFDHLGGATDYGFMDADFLLYVSLSDKVSKWILAL